MHEANRISCVYYPTTALLIDDSNRFLSHITLSLGKNLPYKLYNDPIQALKDLQENNLLTPLSPEIISTDLKSSDYWAFSEKHPISLNISKLHHAIYNPTRFSQISVVVVDYVMPKMNGLEFCKQLKGTAVKKIMLTGEADEVVAVEAFNNGLINKFIVKNQPELGKILIENIYQLQKQSFQDFSEVIIKGLASEPNICIIDQKFITFFDQLCQNFHITDYYLIDTSGSFLLLDEKGMPTWLIIKNEEEMEELTMQAIETNAPASVIEALSKRDKLAYLNNPRDYAQINEEKWEDVLYPAKKLAGTKGKNYFYCVLKELPTFTFEPNNVVPLKNYIEKYSHK